MAKKDIPFRGHLSERFLKTLKSTDKKGLKNLVDYVRDHQELDMQFRDNKIDIYYDGGCALEVKPMSMNLDQYYFYLFKNENSPKDVPESTIIGNFRKDYIEAWKNNSPKEESERPDNYPQKEEADAILKEIKCRCDSTLETAKAGDFNAYFTVVKDVVRAWVQNYNHKERRDQHYIACSNRYFTNQNDLVVIDIEFAVSKKKLYNNIIDSKHHKGKNARFDIIAVDKDGQLYAIELKANLAADKDDSKQNVDSHQSDFDKTIGRHHKDNDFVEEMRQVLKLKQDFNLIDKTVKVDCEYPIFAVAFSGEEAEKREFTAKHKGLKFVDVDKKSDKEFYLKLK
jgi:hypothetical protein